MLEICADGCPCWVTRDTDLTIAGGVLTYTTYGGEQQIYNVCADIVGQCSIDALVDVETTGATPGDVLTFIGGEWVPQAASAFECADLETCSISDLGDVDTAGGSAGDTLLFNGTNWTPVSPCAALTSCSIGDLGDVNVDIVNPGDVLTFIGGEWVPQAPGDSIFECAYLHNCSIGDLGDVITTTPPEVGQVLTWTGTFWTAADPDCKPDGITNNQDLVSPNNRRITIAPDACYLNIPERILALMTVNGNTNVIPPNVFVAYDDEPGMNGVGTTQQPFGIVTGKIITVPYSGVYDIVVAAGADDGSIADGESIFVSYRRNGAGAFGRFSAVKRIGFATQATGYVPNFPLNAGDTLEIVVAHTNPTGATFASGYLGITLKE